LSCFSLVSFAHAQLLIDTVAGGSGPNAIPATLAGFSARSVAVDGAGNLFIADPSNHRVLKVDAGGIITTVAGRSLPGFSGDAGPGTAASLSNPNGVALDGSGNLYIADSGNNRIRKVTGGIITTVAGTGVFGFNLDGKRAASVCRATASPLPAFESANHRIGQSCVEVVWDLELAVEKSQPASAASSS